MKGLHTILAGLALVLATSQVATAQQVRLAAGARVGTPMGLSAKAFLTDAIAFEFNATVRQPSEYRETNINGGLFFYMTDHGFSGPAWRQISLYGGLGLGRSYYKYDADFLANLEEQSGIGGEGQEITRKAYYAPMSLNYKAYIGAQYLPQNLPLEFTLDFGPSITTGKVVHSLGGHVSLGARYILWRQRAKG